MSTPYCYGDKGGICMKVSVARCLYGKMRNLVFSLSTIISPTLNTKLRYRYLFKRKLNLKKPETFNEKLLWLKLKKYNHDPLVIQCADKYRVRDYVKNCGYEDILVGMLGNWDSAENILWDELPDKFVLKWNFGAGMNIVCKDKDALDRTQTVKQMNKWQKNKYWLSHSEMQYKYMPKKIICEEYLEYPKGDTIPDYKIYCFHGKPKAILVMHNRGKQMSTEFFSTLWEPLDNSSKYATTLDTTPKPVCLEQMLQAAEKLASPFPFVRCDFYVIGDKFYFGELTFTPAGGMYTSETKIDGKDMTEYLNIP